MTWTKEQSQRVLAEIRRRADDDPEFRKLCLTRPAAAVREASGVDVPAGFALHFKEDAHGKLRVMLPGIRDLDLRDTELDRIVGGQAGSCFAAGTLILTTDGGTKPIETLRPGDHVLAGDEQTGTVAARPVTKLLEHGSEPLYKTFVEGIAEEIYLTRNHPFFAQNDWVQIGKLPLGTELCRYTEKSARFSRPRLMGLEPTNRVEPVYNLDVAVDHTYFVCGLLVHNGSVIRGIGNAK